MWLRNPETVCLATTFFSVVAGSLVLYTDTNMPCLWWGVATNNLPVVPRHLGYHGGTTVLPKDPGQEPPELSDDTGSVRAAA
jgi:hypothetical protein